MSYTPLLLNEISYIKRNKDSGTFTQESESEKGHMNECHHKRK